MSDLPAAAQRRIEILVLLERLHRHKDAAYGDAWRKRGEIIAIFANLARKYDRLTVAFDEQRPAATEPLADTIADLCVYAGKYLTWIAEQHPADLDAAGLPGTATEFSDNRGPDALQALLAAAARTPTEAPPDVGTAWTTIQQAFGTLERGLIAQATTGSSPRDIPSYTEKAQLAWTLVEQSAWLLTRLADEHPTSLEALNEEVTAMDRAAQQP